MQENIDSYSRQGVNENIQPQAQPPVKQPKSTGSKCLIGCGIGCLLLVIISGLVLGVGGYFAYKYTTGKINAWSQKFEDMGFEKIKGQIIEIVNDVNVPTLYLGQTVKVMGDCKKDIAIIAQSAEIHGKVAGTVYFRGQRLVIQPRAVIEGDLDVKAQSIEIYGQVKGQIKGTYQTLENKRPT
jgi:hypothetical protein